jgi:hypothetical protein
MQAATTRGSVKGEPHVPSPVPPQGSLYPADLVTEAYASPLLDAIVGRANQLTLFGLRYRPYWIMSDAAAVSALLYAWAFARRFPRVSAVALGSAVLVALLVYKIVLEIKAALGKTAARSFLQDCVMIIIPCFMSVCRLLGQPLDLTLAFLGTLLPLYGCLRSRRMLLGWLLLW